MTGDRRAIREGTARVRSEGVRVGRPAPSPSGSGTASSGSGPGASAPTPSPTRRTPGPSPPPGGTVVGQQVRAVLIQDGAPDPAEGLQALNVASGRKEHSSLQGSKHESRGFHLSRGRVAGGIAAPGSHRSRRDSLPSPGSSHQPIRTHEPIANGRTGRVLLGFGMFPRFLPGPEPRLTEPNIPGEPAPWLPRHPRKQRVHGYYGPVRRRAPRRYSVPSVSASARSLSRPSGACCDPGRRIDARLLTFRARAADQAHAASTPGTAWPVHGYPPGSSRRAYPGPPVSMPSQFLSTPQRRTPHRSSGGAVLERLPGPHLTRSSRAVSRIAHHDSLQLTQHRVV